MWIYKQGVCKMIWFIIAWFSSGIIAITILIIRDIVFKEVFERKLYDLLLIILGGCFSLVFIFGVYIFFKLKMILSVKIKMSKRER